MLEKGENTMAKETTCSECTGYQAGFCDEEEIEVDADSASCPHFLEKESVHG